MKRNITISLLCTLLVAIALLFVWLKNVQNSKQASTVPFSLSTTFRGDPSTSRAFTWHSNSESQDAVLQVIKGTENVSFEGEEVQSFPAEATQLTLPEGAYNGVYKAEATGLEPGTAYTYRVGNGIDDSWSEPAVFTTAKQKTDTFTFINVTDSQGITEQDFALWGNTLDKAFATFPAAEFIVHNGDLTENPEDEQAWKAFFGKTHWLATYPLMPVTGNHDEVDNNADFFTSHFNLPTNGSESTIPGTNYSFDYGPVHFVFLNTESKKKKQAAWLEKDLQANEQKWVIAAIHRPAYGGDQKESVLEHLVPIFDEFEVDLVLQGHNHEYSRSYPLRDGEKTSSGGTIYVTINTAGQKFNDKKEDQFYQQVHFQNYLQMFAGVQVEDNVITYQAYDTSGQLLDSFRIEKK